MSAECRATLDQLVSERKQADRLIARGLTPTRSAFFLGNPGVGKTLAAKWIASQLGLPLLVLDLTAVMSSYLGKTGNNLRVALDYAKETPCVLLLDEIDAIAKRRNDESDVGELKRLVTIMLQEVELWPSSGLLLAATNHPELIDRALWRRFDLVVEFVIPDHRMVAGSLKRFLGNDYEKFSSWVEVLALCFKGESFSEIEKTIQRFRRALALEIAQPKELIESYIVNRSLELPHNDRISLATLLAKRTGFSQRAVSGLTGVSRDTIRKHG
ncbi:MAG TPA: AAA family ATPase [Gammaproteobacteria bacterium]|nr:AAA family ATPase [Gammaproteobacteria bacterium]